MIPIDNARLRKGRFILFVLGSVFIIVPVIYGEWQKQKAEKDYFNNLHLKLTGVINYLDKPNGYNGFGILGLHVLSSNIAHYDKRSDPPYYCLIVGDSAEIYCTIGEYSIDDTVKINTDKKQFTLLKKNGIKIEYMTYWKDENRFYDRYLKRHQRIRTAANAIPGN